MANPGLPKKPEEVWIRQCLRAVALAWSLSWCTCPRLDTIASNLAAWTNFRDAPCHTVHSAFRSLRTCVRLSWPSSRSYALEST
eukprot:4304196-Alexandrium_andersonii.AAC.1